jgi:hypothetical protein
VTLCSCFRSAANLFDLVCVPFVSFPPSSLLLFTHPLHFNVQVYGYMAMLQSIDLTSDLKLGLYMKIPPRSLFIVQVYGTALGSVVNYLLINGVIASKRDFLDGTVNDPTQQWSGRKPEIFFVASVIFVRRRFLVPPERHRAEYSLSSRV